MQVLQMVERRLQSADSKRSGMTIDSFRETLIAAGMEANTDKISTHHYDRPYAKSLYRFRDKGPFAMLEIGYGSGAGVKFWKSLFPEAFIYCFDRDAEGEEDRVKVLKVDQSDLQGLQLAIEQIAHPIDLIIDDGSHHPSHQILTFACLFPALLSGNGLYAIEDIETSYWRNGSLYGYAMNYGLNDPWSVMEAFKVAADYVNRRFLCEEDQSLLQYRMMSIGLDPQAVEMVESILFSRNCIFLEKLDASSYDMHPYNNSFASSRFLPG
jgi:hypothetical protein